MRGFTEAPRNTTLPAEPATLIAVLHGDIACLRKELAEAKDEVNRAQQNMSIVVRNRDEKIRDLVAQRELVYETLLTVLGYTKTETGRSSDQTAVARPVQHTPASSVRRPAAESSPS